METSVAAEHSRGLSISSGFFQKESASGLDLSHRPVDTQADQRPPSTLRMEHEAFRVTIGPVTRSMLKVARRILGDEFHAWDAVQEALIGFWELPEPPPNPRGWLLRAVALRSLHQARSRARRRRHEMFFCRIRPEASDRDSASIRLEQDELSRSVEELLRNLSEPSRQVVSLRMSSNLDYASIAHQLGIPIGTVRSRLSRTRDLIRDMLERGILFRAEPRSGRSFP